MKQHAIIGMTLAVFDMPRMIEFYTEVFDTTFTSQKLGEAVIYTGEWAGLPVLFSPAALADITAEQNRHQFEVLVPDLNYVLVQTVKYGGDMFGEISEDLRFRSIAITDPDRNTIVIKELKSTENL